MAYDASYLFGSANMRVRIIEIKAHKDIGAYTDITSTINNLEMLMSDKWIKNS